MNLTLIAAVAKNHVIGKDNDLVWHLPDDFKHFKELTKGHHVIMGRKTFESMPAGPLKNRINIVITSQKDFEAKGCIVVHSLEDAIMKAESDTQPFIIGGSTIYKLALPYAKTIELTEVDASPEGDTFFPKFDKTQWIETSRVPHPADERHKFAFDFITYSRE